MIYLASPYTHSDHELRALRYDAAVNYVRHAATELNQIIYSPIVHWHPVALVHLLPGDHKFWLKQNLGMLQRATELHVLMLDGYNESVGVAVEIEYAQNQLLPINYVQPV